MADFPPGLTPPDVLKPDIQPDDFTAYREAVYAYLKKQFSDLESALIEIFRIKANKDGFNVFQGNQTVSAPDPTITWRDTSSDGTQWRIKNDAGVFYVEKNVSGTWTTCGRFDFSSGTPFLRVPSSGWLEVAGQRRVRLIGSNNKIRLQVLSNTGAWTTATQSGTTGEFYLNESAMYDNNVQVYPGATAATQIVAYADRAGVEDTNVSSLNQTVTITTSGAGGLDTGAEAANTWYYLWIICNDDGTTASAILSASSTSPTLPSGYTKKRRIASVFNDNASNLIPIKKYGHTVSYLTTYSVVSGTVAVDTDVVLTTYMPPTSRLCFLKVRAYKKAQDAASYIDATVGIQDKDDGTAMVGAPNEWSNIFPAEAGLNRLAIAESMLMCSTDSSQTIQYKNANTTNYELFNIYIVGYVDSV